MEKWGRFRLTRKTVGDLEAVNFPERHAGVLCLTAGEPSGYTSSVMLYLTHIISHIVENARIPSRKRIVRTGSWEIGWGKSDTLKWPYPKNPPSLWPYICSIMLELLVYSHMDEYFFWQNLHVPQAMLKDTTTRSPALRLVTSVPTRSMIPLEASAQITSHRHGA